MNVALINSESIVENIVVIEEDFLDDLQANHTNLLVVPYDEETTGIANIGLKYFPDTNLFEQ